MREFDNVVVNFHETILLIVRAFFAFYMISLGAPKHYTFIITFKELKMT